MNIEIMSRDVSIVELSSESDSEPLTFNSDIELIGDDDDSEVDDDVKIVSVTTAVAPRSTQPATATTAPVLAVKTAMVKRSTADSEWVVVLDEWEREYYAPRNGLLSPWRKCRIVSESNSEYKIKFTSDNELRVLPRYQVALNKAPTEQLMRGTRVIAALVMDEDKKYFYFYAGIVGETIMNSNKFHYMIFFDNGRVKYIRPLGVRAVKDNDRWQNVHENARKFMEYFFARNSAVLPIVKGALHDRLQVECDGKWHFGEIRDELYESMIQIMYEDTKRSEWFYRGSPRLGPIWREYIKRQEVSLEISLIETYSSPEEDNDDDDDDSGGALQERPTTSGQHAHSAKNGTRSGYTHLRPRCEEIYRAPHKYETHDCTKLCAVKYPDDVNLKKYGPLAWPMLMGWTREIAKKTLVWYVTPCGKAKRNIQCVRTYLQAIECKYLDVDNFTFDSDVDCLRVFIKSDPYVLAQDLANGAEGRPIRVINEYDTTKPEKFTYVSKMCFNRNVPNYEKDHVDSLSCCDCTDDCYNRFECSCWQLTLAGLQYSDQPHERFAYDDNKRLQNMVSTAIYECNVNCKCSRKCSNRVVQHPISHNFELYKTHSCGWGVRCLTDLPKGAFVCCYFGDIMTEEHCEQLAKKHGDTYLAQLNFIELGEEFKEGFESDARLSPGSSGNKAYRNYDEPPPTKKMRTLHLNGDASQISSGGSSSSNGTSSSIDEDEPFVAVISYFPRTETTNESHPTRQLFGKRETVYIIDGKRCGNIGRFFNHSCDSNMFMQNVFVDTHDLRFPRLALFTSKPIKAGTQLTWDYNYVVGSVENRQLKCECGTRVCRGRLL